MRTLYRLIMTRSTEELLIVIGVLVVGCVLVFLWLLRRDMLNEERANRAIKKSKEEAHKKPPEKWPEEDE